MTDTSYYTILNTNKNTRDINHVKGIHPRTFIREKVKALKTNADIDHILHTKYNDKHLMLTNASYKAYDQNKGLHTTHKTKRIQRISNSQRKKLNLTNIDLVHHKYDAYVHLHRLWISYIRQLTYMAKDIKQKQTLMIRADFHGALIQVIRAKNPTYVGIKAIILQETMHTFKCIENNNKFKSVPKHGTVLKMEIDNNHTMTIYATAMRIRPTERIKRRFKTIQNVYKH